MPGMTPADLYNIAWVTDARISPDGTQVAFVRTQMDESADDYRSAIWLAPADGSAEPRQLSSGAKRDTAPRWSPDGGSLAFLSEREDAKPQLYVLALAGGEARALTNLPLGAGIPFWSPDGARIAFLARTGTPPDPDPKKTKPYRRITSLKYKYNGEGFVYDKRKHLFVVNLAEGATPEQITDGDWDDSPPSWSPDGSALAFSSQRHGSRDFDTFSGIFRVDLATRAVRAVLPADTAQGGPSWSPDGQTIGLVRKLGLPGNGLVFRVDADGGHPQRIDGTYDRNCGVLGGDFFEPPTWTLDGKMLISAEDRGRTHIIRTGANSGTTTIVGGDRVVTSFSVDAKRTKIAFTATSPTAPAEVFVCDVTGANERQLSHCNRDWLASVTLAPAERFTVAREEGVELDCWIMKPHGFQPDKAYPVLLNVHGGPFAQYGESFLDEFQVYTGAGYGVVFCNPRGSSGQDSAFAAAPAGKLGTVDYEDVMAAFDAALERMPWADRRRLGVMGGSYGGFMTTWIVGNDRRFRAAVSERAVNDWYGMQGNSDIGATFNPVYLGRTATIHWDLDAVIRQSPLTHAPKIVTPVLIIHSEDDLRCPIEQGEQLFVALKLLKKDVEFVRFPDENHELSRAGKPGHRVDRFDVILEWFDRKMKV